MLENLRHAPDFALVSNDKTKVFLVEVKYRSEFTNEDVLEVANKISKSWDLCFLFLASRDGFYFDSVQEIANKNGEINDLPMWYIRVQVPRRGILQRQLLGGKQRFMDKRHTLLVLSPFFFSLNPQY